MSAANTGGPGDLEELYRQLASHRAEQARAALASQPAPDRVFAQSACALEDAAGVLTHAAAAYAQPHGPLARRLDAQADGLINTAGRFEAAADIARRQPRNPH